jgi:hypothetical protein
MALQDVFLTPLGLLALAAAVPIVLLYLVRPDPREVTLPTLRFLGEESGRDRTNPFVERLRRNLLLLLQLLAVAAVALSLASPYVAVSESETVRETAVVVDASASMQTTADGGTRFARAVSAAREAVTGTTSVVVAGATPRVALRRGDAATARQTLDGLAPTDAPGDLRSAIATASALAGEEARIVVVSDFADDTAWADAVRAARGRGLRVELRQFAGGGADNVGIVDRSFDDGEVTVAVENFGTAEATRTLTFAGSRRRLTLAPGDRGTATFDVPAGGGEARLTPGDSMPADDAAYVAAPADGSVDVLLLTNDRNRFLAAALSVVDEVSLTIKSPPTVVEDDYDVVVYSNLDPDDLLPGNVEAGRRVIENGGGVAVQAGTTLSPKLGDLVLVAPQGVKSSPTVSRVADAPLTAGIRFSPPERYLAGPLRRGEALVELEDGSPLIATDRRGAGRVLYYGYIGSASAFKYNYQYPVFWKRAVFYLADRRPLAELNRETGGTLSFTEPRTVQTPGGSVTTDAVRLDAAGVYVAGDERVAASLLSPAESDVAARPLSARRDRGDEAVPATTEQRQVPRRLGWVAALAAVLVVLGEVGYLYRRGDL